MKLFNKNDLKILSQNYRYVNMSIQNYNSQCRWHFFPSIEFCNFRILLFFYGFFSSNENSVSSFVNIFPAEKENSPEPVRWIFLNFMICFHVLLNYLLLWYTLKVKACRKVYCSRNQSVIEEAAFLFIFIVLSIQCVTFLLTG